MHNEGVVVAVRAVLLGERLDTRNLELQRLTPTGPATLRIADGYAIVFRYGAVVMFDVPADQETSLLNSLRPLTTEPYDVPDRDATRLAIRPDLDERINSAGIIYIRDAAIERIQAIAHILAQSLVLAHYEAGIAAVFDRIEPLAAALETQGRVGVRGKELISQIGTVLRVQHRMVGRVETGEKPDMLWDHPDSSGSMRGLPTSTNSRNATRASTASSSSFRARSSPCKACCRTGAVPGSNGTLFC